MCDSAQNKSFHERKVSAQYVQNFPVRGQKMKTPSTVLISAFAMLTLLSGCNGGSGSTATTPTTSPTTSANSPPVANAGAAQSVTTGDTISLNGTASTDPNGDLITYRWSLTTRPAGSVATLSSTSSALPTFTVDIDGAYMATLIVNDGKVDSTPATSTTTATQGISCTLSGGGMTETLRKVMRINPTSIYDSLTYPRIYPTVSAPEPYLKLVTTATSGTPTFSRSDTTITQSRVLQNNFWSDDHGADAGYSFYGTLPTGAINIMYQQLNDPASVWFNPSASFIWTQTYDYSGGLSSTTCAL
jgi:hypothetical protein